MVLLNRFPEFLDDTDEIERVIAQYVAVKRDRQLLDYDDLLSRLHDLLSSRVDVHGLLSTHFQHILVDEFQDTNAVQGAIIDLLGAAHSNVCVVGDDSQSIYSFRGAHFDNLLTFKERYPNTREYRLETNYRSTPEILRLANESIAKNTRRLPKELRSELKSGMKPCIVTCYDQKVQAQFIAEYALYLLEEGRELTDIGILYRSNAHATDIELELQRCNIPYKVRGGVRFFEQAHIKDLIAFLRIVHNPTDELSFRRALQLLPKIGNALARRIWEYIRDEDNPLDALSEPDTLDILPVPAQAFFGQFVQTVEAIRAMNDPAAMVESVLRDYYDDHLTWRFDNAASRRDDLKGLAQFAAQYGSLESFLSDTALAGDITAETVVEGKESGDHITLTTIHQAKGLEWAVVLVPWLADGKFPSERAINTLEDEEEERRVFHVAVTRARDELYLIVPQSTQSARGIVMMKPSRFLTELSDDLTEPMMVEAGLPELIAGETTPSLTTET